MRPRIHQMLLVVSLLWLSWLDMMLVHEAGHALAAVCSGGHVTRVIWHPLVLSRTDVQPNPSPLIVVWGGPLVGCLVPVSLWAGTKRVLRKSSYLVGFFAGFCLVANGGYIGAGVMFPVGDAREMLRLGTPRWVLGMFGVTACLAGTWMMDRSSPKLGFGAKPEPVSPLHTRIGLFAAVILTCLAFVFGNRD